MANEKASEPQLPELTLEGLFSACVFLMKRVRDALIDAATLRALLEQRGAFSAADFEKMRVYAESQWHQQAATATRRSSPTGTATAA